jgi:hypothetical protein
MENGKKNGRRKDKGKSELEVGRETVKCKIISKTLFLLNYKKYTKIIL